MKLSNPSTKKPQANSLKLLNTPSKKASPLQRSARKITAKIKRTLSVKSASTDTSANASSAQSSPTQSSPTQSSAAGTVGERSAASSDTPAVSAKGLPFVKDSKGSRLAFNLLLVRPWVLVAGFWVVSLLGAAVAWEGMISPKKLTMELPQPEAQTTEIAQKDTFLKVEQDAEAEAKRATQAPVQETETATKTRPVNAADGSSFPAWPLGALVGTCAAGCLAISRRRAVMRMATARSSTLRAATGRSSQSKRRVRTDAAPQAVGQSSKSKVTALRSSQPVAGKATLRGLTKPKKRRQRRRSTAASTPARRPMGTAAVKTIQPPVLVSRSTAKKQVPADARRTDARKADARKTTRRVKRTSQKPGYRKQPVVSVVPASESHALDWRNGSLAHKLDVRPQRTASM